MTKTVPTDMHSWTSETDLYAHSVIGYAIERLRLPKDPKWGAHPQAELAAALDSSLTELGVGGLEALRLMRDVIVPACRPQDDPRNLAYVPGAATVAATMFDLVVSASSIFAGLWEAGAGAIEAENQVLRWLADLAGFGKLAGGVFVSGGSSANLSALVAARHAFRERTGTVHRVAFAATTEVHASVRATALVMDCDVVTVAVDERGCMTAIALRSSIESADANSLFAVVATAGTTNTGAIDELAEIAAVCQEFGLWLHVDGAYGLAALASRRGRALLHGLELADSFSLDPHKWLFAPYDCGALIYKDLSLASRAHAQHGSYLDAVDRSQPNPSDYAYHLSRRARGLPLWFSIATHGTAAYESAIDCTLQTASDFADAVDQHEQFELLLRPQLSIVLFSRIGWTTDDYHLWSTTRAHEGVALIVPTTWRSDICMRVCIVHPHTTLKMLTDLLADMAHFVAARA